MLQASLQAVHTSLHRRCVRPLSISSFADHAAAFHRDGFAIVRGVLDAGLVAEMQEHVKFLTDKFPTVPPEHLHHTLMRNDPFWVRVLADPRLLELGQAMAPFLSPDVALFSSHIFCKPPRTGSAVLWHQDGSYWPLRPMDVLTLWVAVNDSTADNGCLRVVKGSHTLELAELVKDDTADNVLSSATHTDEDIAALGLEVVNLELAPGDVSIHHPAIIHGSNANTSPTQRCGVTVRYMAPSTVCLNPDQPVMMLRGDITGANPWRSWPKYRPGYDFPFEGADGWNAGRFVGRAEDEAWFDRTDFEAVDAEVLEETLAFIRSL